MEARIFEFFRSLRRWAIGSALLATACTIVSADEAERLREAQSGAFDAKRFAEATWRKPTIDQLRKRALPLERLRGADLDALGRVEGSRAGEGSPWTFVVRATGTVRAVELDKPRGAILLGTGAGDVRIQTGPVVSGTSIRDALPTIVFDDFPDQIAFAEAGQQLTERALTAVRPQLGKVRPGMQLTVFGAANVTSNDAPILLTPFAVSTTLDAP